jgi:uncharacterized protein
MMSSISRREMLISSTGMMVGSWLNASHPQASASESKKLPPFIDVHTHIGTTWNGNKELTADDLLKWMDEHGIERSILLPLVSPESSSFLLLTEPALQAAKDHPDRFTAFCSIDPRTSVRGGVKGFKEIVQSYVERGAKGFGEHKVGLPFDDPLMMQIYEVCEDVGIPLLFHMDSQRGIDEPGLPRLEHALSTFSELDFIGHGPGWWASISGDIKTKKDLGTYPKGKVAPGGAIDRLMGKYPNIYGDMSAGSGNNAFARDPDFGREFLIRRQDRLMFGTDYLQPGQGVPQFETMVDMKLPYDVEVKIRRKNAERVIDL